MEKTEAYQLNLKNMSCTNSDNNCEKFDQLLCKCTNCANFYQLMDSGCIFDNRVTYGQIIFFVVFFVILILGIWLIIKKKHSKKTKFFKKNDKGKTPSDKNNFQCNQPDTSQRQFALATDNTDRRTNPGEKNSSKTLSKNNVSVPKLDFLSSKIIYKKSEYKNPSHSKEFLSAEEIGATEFINQNDSILNMEEMLGELEGDLRGDYIENIKAQANKNNIENEKNNIADKHNIIIDEENCTKSNLEDAINKAERVSPIKLNKSDKKLHGHYDANVISPKKNFKKINIKQEWQITNQNQENLKDIKDELKDGNNHEEFLKNHSIENIKGEIQEQILDKEALKKPSTEIPKVDPKMPRLALQKMKRNLNTRKSILKTDDTKISSGIQNLAITKMKRNLKSRNNSKLNDSTSYSDLDESKMTHDDLDEINITVSNLEFSEKDIETPGMDSNFTANHQQNKE